MRAGYAKQEASGSCSEFPSVAELKIKVIKLEEETARKPVPAALAPHGPVWLGGPLLAQEPQGRGPGPLLAHG